MPEEQNPQTEMLFQPLTINGVTLENRIVVPPMATNREPNHDAGLRWYCRLAADGPGLIFTGAMRVQLFDHQYTVRNLRPLVEAVHERGPRIAAQLFPSPIGARPSPTEVEPGGVRELVELFARATQVCMEAGFDGVEIHGAHGYLINQFFSPVANTRTDDYGGSMQNRCRFGLELARACRQAAGQGLLFYRHTPLEKDGYTIEDSFVLTDQLLEAGVDVLDISPGGREEPGDWAAPFKHRYSHVPVIAVGRMDVVDRAVAVLREGRADLVAVGRGMIVDAAWPRKVREGNLDQVRLCRRCNTCFDRLWAGHRVGCVQWPEGYDV